MNNRYEMKNLITVFNSTIITFIYINVKALLTKI